MFEEQKRAEQAGGGVGGEVGKVHRDRIMQGLAGHEKESGSRSELEAEVMFQ